jgi:hypothetical protein
MWEYLGKIANIVQIASIFPFLLTAYLFWSRAKKYKKLLMQQEGITTSKPIALAIGLVGTGDISGQVCQFLKEKNLQMEIESYSISVGKGITKDNIQKILRDLLKIKAKLTNQGVTEVHLFLAAPVAMCTAIGSIFDSWVPVKTYQAMKTGGYEFWTILHGGSVPGLDDSLLKDIIEAEI